VAFSPQANYTDWATATCWRNLVPTFADGGVSRGQRGASTAVFNLSFLDQTQIIYRENKYFIMCNYMQIRGGETPITLGLFETLNLTRSSDWGCSF
jgi:hypothetical protein